MEDDQKEGIRKKAFSGFFWRFFERIAAQGVQLLVSIILARLLTPEDYGIIALITVFISISTTIVGSGLGNALIQKIDADQIDFSSVFYINMLLGFLMYMLLFAAAPLIADFYHEPALVKVLRVLGLTLIIAGINGVQRAYVSRHLQFKRFFFSTLIGTLISALIGIGMAYKGMGYWALVAQNLTNHCIDTLVLWFTVRWRPTRDFSLRRMKSLYSFGWKLLASSLLNTMYSNVFSLVVGKIYHSADLAYYNRGNQIPALITTNIDTSIQSVLLPVMSGIQNDRSRLKAMVRRSIRISAFTMMPAMAGLAAIAEPLTCLLLTEKWLPSVPYMRVSCFLYSLWSIHTSNLQAINAMGRSDIFLKLEVIKSILGIGMLVLTIPGGLGMMLAGMCLNSILATAINAAPNRKFLNYCYGEQIRDILPAAALSAAMGIVVWTISLLNLNLYLMLALQISMGAALYMGLAALFKIDSFSYLIQTAKQFLYKRNL